MSASRIEYSEKYADDDHEYRYVKVERINFFSVASMSSCSNVTIYSSLSSLIYPFQACNSSKGTIASDSQGETTHRGRMA